MDDKILWNIAVVWGLGEGSISVVEFFHVLLSGYEHLLLVGNCCVKVVFAERVETGIVCGNIDSPIYKGFSFFHNEFFIFGFCVDEKVQIFGFVGVMFNLFSGAGRELGSRKKCFHGHWGGFWALCRGGASCKFEDEDKKWKGENVKKSVYHSHVSHFI